MEQNSVNRRVLLPVLAGFFIMGFCDIVAPISAYIAKEMPAANSLAVSFLPSMVFLWFLLLPTPIASIMGRIGRKRTALIGYTLTIVGLLTPYLAGRDDSLTPYFIGFGLLGIGNTVVQVAVNPLLASLAPSNKMTSYLTIGQICRNSSLLLLAPISTLLIAYLGSWRLLLPLYAALTLLGGVWLQLTTVTEEYAQSGQKSIWSTFSLLRNSTVAICVVGIAAFIATDVSVGFLSVRLVDSPSSMLTTTGFYALRIIGTVVGAWVLSRFSDVKYLRLNMVVALALALFCMLFAQGTITIYITIALMGFTLSCVFATLYAVAAKSAPDRGNDVAALCVMAISAGAVAAPVCAKIIDIAGRNSYGLIFTIAMILYLLWASFRLKN